MNDNNFNFNTPPVQQNNNSSDASKIITILMFLIAIGTAGFVLYEAYQNKQKKILNKDVPIEVFDETINITDDVISNVRSLIPKNSSCNNVYYSKQYIDKKFIDSDIDLLDLNNNECTKIPSVYYVNAKIAADTERVYVYDLVLLFDPNSGFYGRNSLVYNIEYGDIIIDVDEAGKGTASIKSLKDYGQVYKYTFRKTGNDVFIYESTEPVDAVIVDSNNNEDVKGEPETIPDEDIPKDEDTTEEDNNEESENSGIPDINHFEEE